MTLPKALFLDDERWRHDLFEERMRGTHEVHHAYTIRQFKSAIAKHTFALMSLDHDLADPVAKPKERGFFVSTGTEETGMDAVDLLHQMPPERHPQLVVVHSWNPVAAPRMVQTLERGGFCVRREQFESRQNRLAHEAEERFMARNADTSPGDDR